MEDSSLGQDDRIYIFSHTQPTSSTECFDSPSLPTVPMTPNYQSDYHKGRSDGSVEILRELQVQLVI